MILDERTRADLADTTRFRDIRILEEVDSTNRIVAELAAEGAPEGVVVAADYQTAGRGRLDRRWEAPAGSGLLVSALLRPRGLPTARSHLVTAACGLAAQSACEEVAGLRPELKWPNDLLVGDRKLAGILAESASGSVVVGMGINVHEGPPGSAVLDVEAGRRLARVDLLVRWLRSYDSLLDDWDRVASTYKERCATLGRDVVVSLGDGSMLSGMAEGLDDNGCLLVRPAGASEEAAPVAVAVGDVTHLR